MKDRRGRPRRRWPILLLEFSPLLAVGYLAVVFAVVPMSLAAQLVAYRFTAAQVPQLGAIDNRAVAAQWMRTMENPDALYGGYNPELDPFSGLERAKAKTFEGLVGDAGKIFGQKPGQPALYAPDASAFRELSSWESTANAGVWAFIVPAPPRPQLMLKVEEAPELIPSAEEMAPYGTTDFMAWLWQQNSSGMPDAKYQVFNVSNLQGGGGGGGDGKRNIFDTYLTKGRDVYRVCALMKADPYGTMQAPIETPPDTDPTSSEFRAMVQARAEETGSNIYVFGPMRVDLVSLREPASAPGTGPALADALWTQLRNAGMYGAVRAEGKTAKAMTPYTWLMLSPGAMSGEGYVPDAATGFDGMGLLFVVGLNENPEVSSSEKLLGIENNPLRRFQLDVAAQSVWLLGFGVAMLGASLVASPAAFIYDRKRESQARVLAEMQRVQQDAHDKVYNRLSALSKRAELTAATVSDSVAKSMDSLAEDIRTTVTDLQRILGDAERASAVAPVESSLLLEQIENACRAQAERLGIAISVNASALPEVDPQVGWDVQCIVEEAANNAAVRGGATHVEVMLRAGQEALIVEVADDGRGLPDGFDIDALPESSTGLRGMRARVERRGGTLRLERRDTGTLLRARLPLA